jgi:hypothetical protein
MFIPCEIMQNLKYRAAKLFTDNCEYYRRIPILKYSVSVCIHFLYGITSNNINFIIYLISSKNSIGYEQFPPAPRPVPITTILLAHLTKEYLCS